MYLNEFDRFVRQELKPLAYVRYGDDFILIVNTKAEAQGLRAIASSWLLQELYLSINKSNSFIIPARHGLHFLGHRIYPASPLAVDRAMSSKISSELNRINAASYKAMALTRKQRQRFPWIVKKEIEL